jgi:hypothetical protein
MHARFCALYFIALDDAHNLAAQINLPGATTIEPSRFMAFLCASPNDALHLYMRFTDVERWPTDYPDLFLFLIADRGLEVQDWSERNPDSGQLVDVVAIEFCSAADQQRFEAAL